MIYKMLLFLKAYSRPYIGDFKNQGQRQETEVSSISPYLELIEVSPLLDYTLSAIVRCPDLHPI